MESVSSYFVGFSGGLLMSIISFSIVFLVCIGLMLMMMALKHFAKAMEKKEQAKEEAAAAPQPGVAAAPSVPVQAIAAEDEGELVAVITAAIVASCGAGAKILSISPTPARAASLSGATGAWRMTGRLQNFEGVGDSL